MEIEGLTVTDSDRVAVTVSDSDTVAVAVSDAVIL